VSELTLTIERIGARGDGIAHHEGRAIFLPFTAPGDVVRARLGRDGKTEVVEILSRGTRREPPCPHFGICGGCSLQHLADITYAGAKRDFVRAALAHRGFDPSVVAPVERVPPGTRRRARLAMTCSAVGFHQRASHRIVDMKTCFILHPKLIAVAQALRPLGLDGTVSLTLADTGIDLLLELPRPLDLVALEALAQFAEAQDLARLSWRPGKETPVPVVQRGPVRMNFAGIVVDLPPDCFLQASAEAETIMRERVLAGVGDSRTIADLFSGIGTFAFALAKQAKVHAVDGDHAAIAALQAAARQSGRKITAETRDLDKRPLLTAEFDRFDAVVFDPPYTGAAVQAQELARSAVKRIVAISCNPASFARDARALVDGGYRLARVVPVDQFLWSAEIELVAHFVR
jgi:23S rRNA (uracil1939-C5)-methyltransferase